jgi:hypothetical protein
MKTPRSKGWGIRMAVGENTTDPFFFRTPSVKKKEGAKYGENLLVEHCTGHRGY